jgi:S-DNA-T family DNA segregation ATPase FtsK/SpoIIIE
MILALLSYDPRDPSWNSVSGRGEVHNWIGHFGAELANGLYQSLGWVAWLVPFALIALAWWRAREGSLRLSGVKGLGLVLIVLSLAGLLAIAESDNQRAFHLGGWIGYILVYGLASLLNWIGTTIALMATLLTGILLATPFSLVGMIMRLPPSERELGVVTALAERFRRWWQQRAAARALREKELQAKAAPPVKEQWRQDEIEAGREIKIAPLAASFTVSKAQAEQSPASSMSSPTVSPSRKKAPSPPTESEAPAASATSTQTAANSQPTPTAPTSAQAAVVANGKRSSIKTEKLEIEDEAEMTKPRSVAEMLSTASVKRAELAQEKTSAEPRLAPPIKNIPRTVGEYKLPTPDMLTPPAPRHELADAELIERARQLAEKCSEFNVSGQVKHISPGPVVTTFEFKPDPGVKYSRVTSLVDDLCLGLKAESIRIDRIPGKSTVGIEVPNQRREIIRLREIIESQKFHESSSKLTLALGKTIDGANYVADLARMPHLLIAGATGAGKSVALNAIILSLLFKATPDEVKLILIDPKRLELGLYADIPHLLTPIVTDPKRASYALKWAVGEMENRYKHLAVFGVRNIDQYNTEVCATVDPNLAQESNDLPKPLPYIVVIIDELADLMMVSARDVEESITRLAQMARAVGIHLVLATQRPSVDVITGLIKANFPSRISFRVSSKVDSRTIIDTNGAEALLGQGDMLFLPPGTSRLVRIHGAYVDEKEVKRISQFIRQQRPPAYNQKIQMSEKELEGEEMGEMKKDEKYEEAVRIVVEMGRASTSVLQRRLRIGYGRAASIIDMMYREGIVGPEEGSKARAVLVKSDYLERLDQTREE